jgi:hypothetical protein
MMRRLLLFLALLVPALARGQVITRPGTSSQITTGLPIYNIGSFGAQPVSLGVAFTNVITANTAAIQATITAACAAAVNNGSITTGVPIVFVPAGIYPINGTITIPCSGLTLKGASSLGPSAGSQLIWTTSLSAGPMLALGNGVTSIQDVLVEDMSFSGFGGVAFPNGGIDFVTCFRCHLNRVQVTGYNVFAIRFQGLASTGSGGFNNVTDCTIQQGQNNSFAFVTVTQTGGVGGPDGQSITGCFLNTPVAGATGAGWIDDSVVAGATGLVSSAGFYGNRFEVGDNSAVIAFTGQRQDTRIIGNRFENTGSGGLTITLSNAITIDPTAYFTGNLWACGSGLCTYTDAGTTQAIRIGDSFGPSTNAAAPGMLCAGAAAITSDAGATDTLGQCPVTAGTINGAGTIFLHIRAWGHTANNANAKTATLTFGGVTLITISEVISTADNWQCDVVLGWRAAGASAQSAGGECVQGATGTVTTVTSATPTFNFGIAQNAQCVVTQVSAADMVQDGFLVEAIGPARAVTLP